MNDALKVIKAGRATVARAQAGLSARNDALVVGAFAERGISPVDIRPRENVFTYQAWRALGRQVRRGEHGVKLPVVVETTREDEETGEVSNRKLLHHATVFHISQTDEAVSERRLESVGGLR